MQLFLLLTVCIVFIWINPVVVSEEVEIDGSGNQQEYGTNSKNSRKLTVFEELLGETLYTWGLETTKDGKEEKMVYEVFTSDLLKNKKVVGLYFSASW